jgi:carbon-monoxide dehydrogenase medium subunit
MYSASFDYHSPSSLQDAIALLGQHGPDAKILAGGHSLLPMMKLRLAAPAVVIDLGRIASLKSIELNGDDLVIGALTTHHAIEVSSVVQQRVPLIAETAAAIGDIQVRNRGTIGGSIAHADPAADWPAALLALDATITIDGPSGRRTLPAGAFFRGMMTTALGDGEILSEIRVPLPPAGRSTYTKVRQRASGFALVGLAIQLTMKDEVCRQAAIGLTGIAAQPSRATRAEDALTGRVLDQPAIANAAALVTDGLDPLDDLHASAEFRAHLARVHLRRALTRLAAGS